MTTDVEKRLKLLNNFLASVFTGNWSSRLSLGRKTLFFFSSPEKSELSCTTTTDSIRDKKRTIRDQCFPCRQLRYFHSLLPERMTRQTDWAAYALSGQPASFPLTLYTPLSQRDQNSFKNVFLTPFRALPSPRIFHHCWDPFTRTITAVKSLAEELWADGIMIFLSNNLHVLSVRNTSRATAWFQDTHLPLLARLSKQVLM